MDEREQVSSAGDFSFYFNIYVFFFSFPKSDPGSDPMFLWIRRYTEVGCCGTQNNLNLSNGSTTTEGSGPFYCRGSPGSLRNKEELHALSLKSRSVY